LPEELLKPEQLARRPPRWNNAPTTLTQENEAQLSASDQAKILDQLRNLGYVA